MKKELNLTRVDVFNSKVESFSGPHLELAREDLGVGDGVGFCEVISLG